MFASSYLDFMKTGIIDLIYSRFFFFAIELFIKYCWTIQFYLIELKLNSNNKM